MRNLKIIVKEDFLNLIKNPMWIFYATVFPLCMIGILGFLTKDLYGKEITSYDYYGITMMIYTAIMSGMTAANAFMEERIKKPNMRIIFAPGNIADIYLSKIIASFFFTMLTSIFDFVILVLFFHVRLASDGILFALYAELTLFSVTLGIMLCCIFKKETTTNQVQSMIINLLAVFGGLMFSLDRYGHALQMISLISPVKWVVNTAFQVIYDANTGLVLPVSITLCGLIVLMLFVCKKTFHQEDCIC